MSRDDDIILFSVRLPRDLHKRLKTSAVQTEQTCTEIIKELIEGYLDIAEEEIF
jgi:predicted DNA-binding protein